MALKPLPCDRWEPGPLRPLGGLGAAPGSMLSPCACSWSSDAPRGDLRAADARVGDPG